MNVLLSSPYEISVVSLGGGTVMQKSAYQIINSKGILIFLSTPLPVIYQRLSQRGLPERLKTASNLEEVMHKRVAYMEEISDYVFRMDDIDILSEQELLSACESLVNKLAL